MKYRDIMLGRGSRIPSRVEYKNALLRSLFALITIGVATLYFIIDGYHGLYGSKPYYMLVVGLAMVTLILNRLHLFRAATFLFLSLINLSIFYFSAIDPFESGVFLYFIVCCLMAFALLGYHQLKLSLFFILVSVTLFILSFWVEMDFLPKRQYTELYLRISYTVNFLVTLLCSTAIFYYLMDVNHYSEKSILEKNAQLEKANAELDRFVYSASHDLRAPLSSLLGLIEVARIDPLEGPKYMQMMKGRILDMDVFIKEIISYSRNSRMGIERKNVDLKKTADEVIQELRFVNEFNNILIENQIDENMIINTDPTRLKVILSNLIVNAIKYQNANADEPYVRIMAQNDKVVGVTISLEDNGIGIDAQHLHKVFRMFYRAHESSKGSGLGLYIVKETVGKLGGDVRVESVPGQGSTFTLRIPKV
ncbi:MAG: HAMP domain-containing sensor histidine kinase [Cyclobacteriaceae bacterium]